MPRELRQFKHSNEGLQDEDVRGLPTDERHFDEVDLSRNLFGPSGIQSIMNFALLQRQLTVLKLYRCGLGDACAEILSEFCSSQIVLDQLHLSHNEITEKGAVRLIYACERGRSAEHLPLWLRLEHNFIARPEEVLRQLESQYTICSCPPGRCGTMKCAWRRKVHLPHFITQDVVYWEGKADHRQDVESRPFRGEDLPEDRASDISDLDLDCRGRGLRAWHGPDRQSSRERSRSPFASALDENQLLAWQEKLLRREKELDELERFALRFGVVR
ncbi:unnamed protein product [Symbiodinium natans]|uniref:Uncharacterized protein n=1 Tax=Symbiodinium natans TaxID=878477 RepID=A0A812J8D3_9DINO|nr:unnamed protein product [Symbiodinium natans]